MGSVYPWGYIGLIVAGVIALQYRLAINDRASKSFAWSLLGYPLSAIALVGFAAALYLAGHVYPPEVGRALGRTQLSESVPSLSPTA